MEFFTLFSYFVTFCGFRFGNTDIHTPLHALKVMISIISTRILYQTIDSIMLFLALDANFTPFLSFVSAMLRVSTYKMR